MVHRRGPGAALHDRALTVDGRLVEVLSPVRPMLALGSTQPLATADLAAAAARGVDVGRRRSGGGAVLMEPGAFLWVDVTIARDDPLWRDDVGESFEWLGAAWAEAVASLGVPAPDVHRGAAVTNRWSRLVCFAGIGAGEVLVDGRKLVGLSQRRTRTAARYQCGVHARWDPVPLVDLLDLDPDERARAADELAGVATGLEVPADRVVAALLDALPA